MNYTVDYKLTGCNDLWRRIDVPGNGLKISHVEAHLGTVIAPDADLRERYDLSWLMSRHSPEMRVNGRQIRCVDLFCGCGGLSAGVREAARALECDFRAVYAADMNLDAASLYMSNFMPGTMNCSPIEQTLNGELGAELTAKEAEFREKVGEVDIIVAGPPCQGNSSLNHHTRFTDERNLLYLRAVRCVEVLRPRCAIIENVPGVAFDTHGVLQTSIAHLKTLGYSVDFGVVNMAKLGVAQARKRMFLVASRVEDVDLAEMVRLAEVPERPLSWAIADLVDEIDKSPFNSVTAFSERNKERVNFLFKEDLYNLPKEWHPRTYKQTYGRMYWDAPAPTITTEFMWMSTGRWVHPLRPRTLTPHEAARVQFFPDFWDWGNLSRTALARAIGNAVPPKASYALALPMLASIL